jgi:hypothetical protein
MFADFSGLQHLDFALFFKKFVAIKILIHNSLPSTRTNVPLSVISVGSVVENGSDAVPNEKGASEQLRIKLHRNIGRE